MTAGSPTDTGIRLRVKLTPGARYNGLKGEARDPQGRPALGIAVAAPPEKGKANAALIAWLSKHLKVPKADITVVRGATGRHKVLEIDGPPEILLSRIKELPE